MRTNRLKRYEITFYEVGRFLPIIFKIMDKNLRISAYLLLSAGSNYLQTKHLSEITNEKFQELHFRTTHHL